MKLDKKLFRVKKASVLLSNIKEKQKNRFLQNLAGILWQKK